MDAETTRSLRRRHADFFRRQALAPEERDNRLAAVRFLFEEGTITECVEMLLTFGSFSVVAEDVVRSLARSPGLASSDPLDRTRILRLATDAHVYRSDFEAALRACREACEIAAVAGLTQEWAIGRRKLSLVLAYLGRREESIALSGENLREGQRRGDLQAIEFAYTNIGTNQWSRGDFEAARAAHEGAYAASVELRGRRPY